MSGKELRIPVFGDIKQISSVLQVQVASEITLKCEGSQKFWPDQDVRPQSTWSAFHYRRIFGLSPLPIFNIMGLYKS
jgi:hypothetical protein